MQQSFQLDLCVSAALHVQVPLSLQYLSVSEMSEGQLLTGGRPFSTYRAC